MPKSIAGYDAMVFAGLQRFLHHRQREEIREALLQKYGLDFSAGEASALTKKFLQYLEMLHKTKRQEIREALAADGGYPLHVDATGEHGQGTLLVALAGWRRWVLDAWRIPTERTEVIHPALRSVTERFGAPCGVVRDLGKAMIPAVKKLVKELGGEIPILSCHQHFLSDIGEDLLEAGHSNLRDQFRHFKVRPKLATLARDLGCKLGEQIAKVRQEVREWQEWDEGGHVLPEGRAGRGAVRSLAQWVLDYKADTGDLDFPFDRPYLALYDRCIVARRAVDAYYRTPPADKSVLRALDRLCRILEVVASEEVFTEVAGRLRKRAALFDELRDALRIVPKQGGRNTQPPHQPLSVKEAMAELSDVQVAAESFVASLQERRPERGRAQDAREAIDIILKHMEDHGDTLWGHVVCVSTPDGEIARIIERTNNILERGLFGEMKQGERRRSGRKNLNQDLEHLPPAAAIARNLLRPDYVELVCGCLENLPEAFAQLDAERRRKRLAGELPTPLDRTDDPIPQIASASLPADDRALVRSDAMRRRVLAAAGSRAPRTRVKVAAPGALATAK
ncbi:MAG: hypothetical protein ACYTG0_44075 [Planctomycetota bacterium]|jgi:hypothetical protein